MCDCDMCDMSVFPFGTYSILDAFSTVFRFFTYQMNLQSMLPPVVAVNTLLAKSKRLQIKREH